MKAYRNIYKKWKKDPVKFWLEAAKDISWAKAPRRGFDADVGVYGRWFPDAEGNTCYNCIDRHIEQGRGQQAALIYDSPVTDNKNIYTYDQLFEKVTVLASALEDLGISKGDRVIIYMPMIPQAAIGMLACARIGAIHSVVFGGFAPKELATRIDDAKPKLILSASCGIEPTRTIPYKPLLDEAIALAEHTPETCIIYQRPECEGTLDKDRDHNWRTVMLATQAAGARTDYAILKATDPLYISTPQVLRANLRALCVTMAVIWLRLSGAWAISTTPILERSIGRPLTLAGLSVIATSFMALCYKAARPFYLKVNPLALPMQVHFGGLLKSTMYQPYLQRQLPFAR